VSSSRAITVFTTSWCGPCRRLKALLHADGISFTAVDIETDPDAERFVIEVNRGYATVPTVLFPDGTTLTNPTFAQVRQQLAVAS